MNEKYTIGDLAKEAGISTKAIRIYEKKGLIKPISYSEGNYRLYDNNAKITLQKIMTLKFVGFSLSNIGELIEIDKNNDILKSLSYQKQLLELKRDHIDRVIYCVDRAAQRCAEGEIDWDSFTDIMREVIIDRKADEGHWAALKYGINQEDWYEKIYRNINIDPNEIILDIGCGYGKLWRNNWSKIPERVRVTLMDLHGTWADDFAKFIEENKHLLQEGADFKFVWGNVENDNSFGGKYNKIIGNYLFRFIKDQGKLLKKIKEALVDGGVFYCIYGGNTVGLKAMSALIKGFNSTLDCIDKEIEHDKTVAETFERLLNSTFNKVEWRILENGLRFKNSNDFYEFLIKRDFVEELNLDKRKEDFEDYFSKLIEKQGEIIIPTQACLYYCR